MVLGIRPDVIRASRILKLLRAEAKVRLVHIWSGQHYSENLKEVFFRELGVPPPDVELGARGETDADLVGDILRRLHPVLQELQPEATVFLGDTNTVMGCLAAAQLNLPLVHIEGCMRSYDWRMPEEKYRTVADHLSDVIYAYFEEYRQQGIREGLNPAAIEVTGNLIVDVLQDVFFRNQDRFVQMEKRGFWTARKLEPRNFLVMTCHRRENIEISGSLEAVLRLAGAASCPVVFPAGYRTQRMLQHHGLALPPNLRLVDPVGYEELLLLLSRSRGVLTDSGTLVEEACVLQVPCVQMRTSTERPQVYDAGGCLKYDPLQPAEPRNVITDLENLAGKSWEHRLGDGQASERIVRNLIRRIDSGQIRMHTREKSHLPSDRAFAFPRGVGAS